MTEEWRDIKGYEGIYQVSNIGKVMRLKLAHRASGGEITWHNKPKEIAISTDKKGYKFVKLSNGTCKRRIFKVHRLVYEAFKSDVPDGFQIDHIDRDKSNNSLKNLRIVTAKENQRNRKDNRQISCQGLTMCVSEWADLLNVDPRFLEARLLRGWTDEQTILTPKLEHWDRHRKVNV